VERVKKERLKSYGNHVVRPLVTPLFGPRGAPFRAGRKIDLVLIEDKNSGISLRQQLRRQGVPVMPYNPGKADKYMRLNLSAPLFVAGYVYAPQSENHPKEFKSWVEPLVQQMCAYSGKDSIEHDDLMDSATQALLWFDRQWLKNAPPKYATRAEMLKRDPRMRGNPYAT
jgi:predicted phage terminase large subunit-like protein